MSTDLKVFLNKMHSNQMTRLVQLRVGEIGMAWFSWDCSLDADCVIFIIVNWEKQQLQKKKKKNG